MKRNLLSSILVLAIFCTTVFLPLRISASDKITSVPLYQEKYVEVSNKPQILTDNAVSTFTTTMNYRHRPDTVLSLQYDVGYDSGRHIYSCDFNNGEVIDSITETATVTNNNGKLTLKGNNWMQTANLAEDMWNLEMSFDVEYTHTWSTPRVYFRGEWMYLEFMGASQSNKESGSTENRIMLHNRRNNDKLFSTVDVSGKRVRILAVDDSVKIYVDGVIALEYTYPSNLGKRTGPIYLTNTEVATTYDNITIYEILDSNDTYYQADIGESTKLYRYINGTPTLISQGSGLTENHDSQLTLKRHGDSFEISADGTALLTANCNGENVSYPCGNICIFSSSQRDSISDLHIYNTTNMEIADNSVKTLTTQTGANPNLTVQSQTGDTGDAAVIFNEDGSFALKSPTALNAVMTSTGILNQDYSDVYIAFDIKNSRPDYTRDYFYFAGYTIECGIEARNSTPVIKVTSPDGENINCNKNYGYYANATTYTMEFIRRGYRVEVYYYPKDGQRTLFFEDYRFNQNMTNFSICKKQGVLILSNFKVYDSLPIAIPKESSGYVLCDTVVAKVPFGTTVSAFKENMSNGDMITVYDGKRALKDYDILTAGCIAEYESYLVKYTLATTYDLNADKCIDVRDIFIAQSGTASDVQRICADTDLSGSVTADDAELIKKAVLGNNYTVYNGNQNPTNADGGTHRITANAGDTLDVTIDLRNLSSQEKNLAAIQAQVRWDGSIAEYSDGSFTDCLKPQNTTVFTAIEPDGMTLLYLQNSLSSMGAKPKDTLFEFSLNIPESVDAARGKVKILKCTAVFTDGTSVDIASDQTAAFDIVKVGETKAEKAPVPTLTERTETYFTVEDTVGFEYSTDGIYWTDNPRFKHLKTGGTYTVYQRVAETKHMLAGEISEPLYVTLYKRGDVNCDGVRDAQDIAKFRRLLILGESDYDPFTANANLDKTVDILDLIRIKKLIINPDDGWVDPTVRGEIVIE